MKSTATTLVLEWRAGRTRRAPDHLASEEPLEIRVNGVAVSVTMRTAGDDAELALGFLVTEGLIARREDVRVVEQPATSGAGNIVSVELAPGVAFDAARLTRYFYAASSCGVCGKASIEAVRVRGVRPVRTRLRVRPELVCALPLRLRRSQPVFARTGGLHAAALFDRLGQLLVVREDVGRHNAVDKAIGWALGEGRTPLGDTILVVSGRGGFEIVQKAAVAGVPVIASVSAPSSLAVDLARELHLTLIGFLRGRRFVVYSGEERIVGMRAPGRAPARRIIPLLDSHAGPRF
jgi:FdhD protein